MSATLNPPTVADSMKRALKLQPVTTQLEIIQHVVEAADFADFDQDELDRLDTALKALLSQSREEDYAEAMRLHGKDVAA